MGERIKREPCTKCGSFPGNMMECLECRTFFCSKCFPPHLLEKNGLPELVNCCPQCEKGDIEYLHSNR